MTPTITKGTELKCGKVAAILNRGVQLENGNVISFKQAEKAVK